MTENQHTIIAAEKGEKKQLSKLYPGKGNIKQDHIVEQGARTLDSNSTSTT